MTDWRDDPEIVALRDALVRAICPGVELTEEESIRARMAVLTDPARFIKTSGRLTIFGRGMKDETI